MAKEKKKKTLSIGFQVLFAVVFILMLAVLELNKNTVLGFILIILASAGLFWVYLKWLRKRGALLKAAFWPVWLAVFALVLLISWPPVKAVKAVDHRNPVKTDIVHVKNGDLQGVVSKDGAIEIYAGIPYAKPPVGELRWRETYDPESWTGVLQADTFAPMSMQPVNLPIYDSLAQIIGYHDYKISLKDNYREPVSEDSLYLNIWKPAGNAENLPVIVYVHGGSLKTGQPWYADYSGEGLAREGVIVVNMGYRLGVFGYFADEELIAESPDGTTGNYGLMDQIHALRWVKENIAAFGGDPDNITLAGESAGATSVSAICVSPLAKGLFRRAVLESSTLAPVSPTHSFRSLSEALRSGKAVKKAYACSTVEELRKVSAEDLVAATDTEHHVTVDGYVLTKLPYESYLAGEFNEEALIHGYNSDEAAAFLIFGNANLKNYESNVRGYFGKYSDEVLKLYPAKTDEEAAANWSLIWGAVFFDYPHYCLNRLEVLNNVPVYEYYFTKENGRLGPWHSGEEVYLYGNIPEDSRLYDEKDRSLSDAMKGYFLNFAKTGQPNGAGLKAWKQNKTSEDLMEFGENYGMIKEGEHELFDILDRMQGFDPVK
ncbi:MAG: carboxylesterase family protein [Lachnospiraceae bacterium]|nr:carboxylesterase family protein [Lachnospiraceae bacterium]